MCNEIVTNLARY